MVAVDLRAAEPAIGGRIADAMQLRVPCEPALPLLNNGQIDSPNEAMPVVVIEDQNARSEIKADLNL